MSIRDLSLFEGGARLQMIAALRERLGEKA